MFDFKPVLDRLAEGMQPNYLRSVSTLPFDRWILASLLQKAIRRGDAERAASAALSLWSQDRRMFWRRMGIISLEDMAFASPETLMEVIAALKSPLWRRSVGDGAVGVELAKRMASVPKTRYLTEMLSFSDVSTTAAKARKWAGKASNAKLETLILDSDKEPYERSLALWGLLGTKKFPARIFSRPDGGDIDCATAVIKKLPVPDEIIAVTLATLTDTAYPLAAFLPIGWLAMQQEKPRLRIQPETPLSSPEVEGLPMYAVDGLYTRIGIAAVRTLRNAVTGLKIYTPEQIGEGFFFLEGEPLNPRMTSDAWDNFRQQSHLAVMQHLGLDADEYAALRRALMKSWDIYNEIRLKQLERTLYGEEKDLFSGHGG